MVPVAGRLRTLPSHTLEHRATVRAIRAVARRALFLEAETAEHESELEQLVTAACPNFSTSPASERSLRRNSWRRGPMLAASANEAAFATLARVAPIPASSGQIVRHRLNRSGDRQLNRALHTVALSRLQHHPETKTYTTRRTAEGKTRRDIKRCLKRAIAREIYRLLEAHAKTERKIKNAA
jgi:transposase